MTRSPRDRLSSTLLSRRLSRLVALAQAADVWEQVWRGLIPPLIVVGAFVCLSWLGVWLYVPHWARASGVALFALGLAASSFGLWRVAAASRRDALRRIDKMSGVEHRPASVLDDRLATAGRDPATDALWMLHLRRAEVAATQLKAGRPSPRVVDLDRKALRFGIVVALLACAIVAGPQRYARVAAAFDFGGPASSGAGYRLDAWIDPPAYTGKAPILLEVASDKPSDPGRPRSIAAPTGSTVIIRSSGGSPVEIEASGPLLPPQPKSSNADALVDKPAAVDPHSASGGDSETRLVLHGDSRLVLRHGGVRGSFDLSAIADRPPTIVLRDLPKANARGSLTLAYTTGDDYGVVTAEAVFSNPKIEGRPATGPSLVDPPKMSLSLPGMTRGIGDAETTADLADHPWMGAQVTMVLVAHDEGGNEGRSEPVEITLPQKSFVNPLARALVEQRRSLVLNPETRSNVTASLDALMVAPDSFETSAGAYLGLRVAADMLAQAQTKTDLVAVADFLWGMALQIENGDLSNAERALRNAEKELRDAIDRHASTEEIQRLAQNLQTAMDKFLQELAEQQKADGQQQAADSSSRTKTINPRDLQKLIERLKQQAQSGNRAEAKKALDELQDILENLKTAKRQKADPKGRAMAQSLNQLDQMMRDQQDLRDDTYRQGQQRAEADRSPGERGDDQSDNPLPTPGPSGQGSQRQPRNAPQGTGKGGSFPQAQGRNDKSLEQRQTELRNRLAEVEKSLKQAGQSERALGDAGDSMHEAAGALQQGTSANGQALDAQGEAIEALQKGAKKLAESMRQESGQGQANADGEGSPGSQDNQQTSESDPLGRPRGGNNILNSTSRFDPLGLPAAQRAQRVLEELRRRLGDPAREQEEVDYLERLLRSY